MKDRIEREPVGFAGAIKATLLALVPLAITFGWKLDAEQATQVLASVGGLGATVELWATWWVRAAVTPVATAQAQADAALELGTQAGRSAAADDVRAMATAKRTARK
jgi:hypothetical protein